MQTVNLEETTAINSGRVLDWIRVTYPALDEVSSFAAQIDAVESFLAARSEGREAAHPNEKMLAMMTTATAFGVLCETEEHFRNAQEELKAVIALANSADSSALLAKSFLLYLVGSGGESLPPGLRSFAIEQASEALASLAADPENTALISAPLFFAFSNAFSFSPAARRWLFSAFSQLTADRAVVSLEGACTALLRAIDVELRLPREHGDNDLLVHMIAKAVDYPHPEIFPVLAAISSTHEDMTVRAAANAALYELEQSTAKLWHDAVPNLVSTVEQRIESLEEALKEKDARECIITLFKTCKDRALPPDVSPLFQVMSKFLDHENDMVKLSTTRVFLQPSFNHSEAPQPSPTLIKTINTLATFAFNTATPHSAREAALLLDSLTNAPASVQQLIEQAKTRASLDFVNKQTQE
jgi:hypothetical protein